MRLNYLVFACVLVTTVSHADDWCKERADRSASLDTAGVKKVVIGAGAGDLKVQGKANETRLIANGQACASNEELLQQSQLESRREGDVLYLKTALPEVNGNLLGFQRYARMDLTVTLPASVTVQLDDSSGDAELQNVAAATVTDSSGDLDIENIAGDLKISDSSGDVEIEHVGGNLIVNDSSGDLELEHIQGSVDIPVDSSGDIRISDVGSVHIENDSSGEIVVQRVKLDVQIDVDSSGDIRAEDVGGNFTVRNDGSGNINHTRVTGKVQLPAGSTD